MNGVAPWRYILSAGRTGTVFLESFLVNHCPGVTAVHEPPPSRQHLMLANLRNDWGLCGGLLAWHFQRSRLQRLAARGSAYVEINPHLCPLADLLPDPARPLRVVHMVREPASWAASMLGFKASTRFRSIIDYIPFATPYPAPRPPGWSGLPQAEKVLWRWNWCNERLLELKLLTPHYCLVRYEDLFGDGGKREQALRRILATLGLGGDLPLNTAAFAERHNPAAAEAAPPDPAVTARICGDLAARLGY
jgi:hypothetical protein